MVTTSQNGLPEKLYHYCPVESFFNIIQSKSIWLCNATQMNDKKECNLIDSYVPKIQEICNSHNLDFEAVFSEYKNNRSFPYLFSLSTEKDSLSQWRGYANNAKGVAIGFNFQEIKIELNFPGTNSILKGRDLGIIPVKYDEKQLIQSIKYLLNKNQMNNYVLSLNLKNLALQFKHPSFKEENEWRIIYAVHSINKNSIYVGNKILSTKKFRVAGDEIKTYFALTWSDKAFTSVLIPEIILGPKCQLDKDVLRDFLNDNNLKDTAIIESDSTYR